MVCISYRASASVIFPAAARAPSASRRQWSASYVGCTVIPPSPAPSLERQSLCSVPVRDFTNGYGVFTRTGGARTMELEALHELARKNNAPLAKPITIALERVRGTRELLAGPPLPPRQRERDPDPHHREAAYDKCSPDTPANL